MLCEETQQVLSLYVDDKLSLAVRATCDEHLHQCPICRGQLAETRSLTRNLSRLSPIIPPADLASSISARLAIEAAARQRQPHLPLSVLVLQWIRPRVMPYTIGSFASILLFFTMFNALRPHLQALREAEVASREADQASLASLRVIYLSNAPDEFDITQPVPPDVYAASRAPFTVQSPSLNPSGALAALTVSRSHGHEKDEDDDMVVVTDVYSNGRASLAGVVQAPRDRRMLEDFQSALRKDPAFVPASYDNRPQTMRVVFVFQKVDVTDGKQRTDLKESKSQKF